MTSLLDHVLANLKRSPRLFADETTAPVFDPGRGRTKTGQLCAYARTIDRGATRPSEHLAGFVGVLQVDDYAG